MKPSFTPLRYPGGKTWLFGYVKAFLEFHEIDLGTVVEPFAGSASISVGLLQNNLADEAYICEKDPLISSFWASALEDNEELVESVESLRVSMDTWWKFRKYLASDALKKFGRMEMATACVFYNRANYSGILKAGPLGGKRQKSKYTIKCRFNKEYINKKIVSLGRLYGKLHVHQGDGTEFIQKLSKRRHTEDLLFYVDPPYYDAGRVLYRDYFNDEDHVRLANALKVLRKPWLLSYDDAEFIRGIYADAKQQFVYTDRQAGNLRRGVRELLLSNRKIPPFCSDFTQMEKALIRELAEIAQQC